MKRVHGWTIGAGIMTAGFALGVAGCGTATVAGPGPGQALTGTVSKAATPAETPKQRAEQAAAAILAAFVAPPGARHLTAAPAAALKTAPELPATPDLVDQPGWWQVAGAPAQVLSWLSGHVPHGYTKAGWGTVEGNVFTSQFSLPAVSGVLTSRELVFGVTSAGSGQTAIRVDAQVIWLPARAPAEKIPAAATAVTLTMKDGLGPNAKTQGPVTITDQATVGKLRALIDGLPRFPPGTYSCPMDDGSSLVLTFTAGAGGPAPEVATVALSGCEGVDLTVGGKAQPGLGQPDGGRPFAAQLLKVAGLHWSLPN